MRRRLFSGALALLVLVFSGEARAVTCPPFPFSLTNGTLADATQVMADFNSIRDCANNLLASIAYVQSLLGAAGTGRTKLTVPTTFHYSLTGNDTTGDGSVSKPWRTRSHAAGVLQQRYDFGGNTVTIQADDDGPYTDGMTLFGPMVGQNGATGLIFRGFSAATVYRPPSANVFAAAYGASFTVDNAYMDQTDNTADIVSVGQLSVVNFGVDGNPNGVTFGCTYNGYNGISAAGNAFITFNTDFVIDPGLCQQSRAGATYSIGSATITGLVTTTGIQVGMGVVSGGALPADTYVNTVGSTSVTVTCVYTNPCVSGSNGVVSTLFTGGGTSFLGLGDGARVYLSSNGQPDYSVVITLRNYPFYIFGFHYANAQSSSNFQAATFKGFANVFGGCAVAMGNSIIDTNFQGLVYFPCLAATPRVSQGSVSLVAGAPSFTVSSATGIVPGMSVNDIATPTGTWLAGASTIAVSSCAGILSGAKIYGEGILSGAIAQSCVGTTLTLGLCGPGPRCVSSYPTYLAGTGAQLYVQGSYMTNASYVTDVTGTTVTIQDRVRTTGTANLWFGGANVNYGGVIK